MNPGSFWVGGEDGSEPVDLAVFRAEGVEEGLVRGVLAGRPADQVDRPMALALGVDSLAKPAEEAGEGVWSIFDVSHLWSFHAATG